MKVVCLEGRVFSGKGEGSKYVGLDWVKMQVKERFGFCPFAGTLNIRLNEESIQKKRTLLNARALEVVPPAGYNHGRLFKATLKNRSDVAVVVPDVPDYPEGVLEIVSSENLRIKLRLSDGDKIKVRIIL